MYYYFYQPLSTPLNFFYPNTLNYVPQIQDQSKIVHSVESISEPSLQNQMHLPQKIILTRQDLEAIGYTPNKRTWTQQEDKLLLFLRDKRKMDWIQISKEIPERNQKMCYSRHKRLNYSTKAHWCQKDDELLLKLVKQQGENWVVIIKHFKDRNIRQIKEHYNNYLRPGIVKRQWTMKQDLELIQLLNKHGKNWKIIQQFFSDRSLNQIKNRYFGRIKILNERKVEQTVALNNQ